MHIKDIVILEKIEKCATKYILNEGLSSYRSRLLAQPSTSNVLLRAHGYSIFS